MRSIDVSEMGINDFSNNGRIWIGDDGPNKLTFTNRADLPVTVVIWHSADFQSSFVRARQPYITYSLPNTGDSVVISVGDSVSGGFAALYDRTTTLSQYGQVYNTWGEFTSRLYATINVSREPNMRGNRIEIRAGGGYVSNMDTYVFKCKSGNSCWQDNTYYLQNCEA